MAERPYALSIAGIDPSAGAGLLADIKTFEQQKVYGLGIPSANTIQTEKDFFANKWIDKEYIQEGVKRMFDNYPVSAVKIGIIEDLKLLESISKWIKIKNPKTFIVWDPVIRSTTNFIFNENWQLSAEALKNIDIVTPNVDEWNYLQLLPKEELSCAVLLKGGHSKDKVGFDKLFIENEWIEISPQTSLSIYPKHGSGCVFSSALTAALCKGMSIIEACKDAKEYTEKFLASTQQKLGFHNGKIALHITR